MAAGGGAAIAIGPKINISVINKINKIKCTSGVSRAPPAAAGATTVIPAAAGATAVADNAGAVVSDVAGPVVAVIMVPVKVMYL